MLHVTCYIVNSCLNKNAFQWDEYRPLVSRISQHALQWGVCLVLVPGGCLPLVPGGLSTPGGCLPLVPGVCSWGVGRVSAPRGVVVYPSMQWADPHVNRMTDRCKNITLPQTSFGGAKYCTQVTRTQVLKYRADVTKTGGISGPTKRTDVLQNLKNRLLFLIYGHFRSSVNVLYVLNGIECFNRPQLM